MNTPARRDLVAEMVEACNKKGLGIFFFYEHGFDWRYPHGPRFADWNVRLTEVQYDPPEPTYAYEDYDLNNYVEFVKAQIKELLTNYGPVAGIWLDGAAVPASGDHTKFKLQELYNMIHEIQLQALISYKWGITGTEDFLAPEHGQLKKVKFDKPTEICFPLNRSWGYVEGEKHAGIDELIVWYENAGEYNANLLVNIGPKGDGSVVEKDLGTLRKVRQYLDDN